MTPSPLAGKAVVVTRARDQAAELVGRLEAHGARAVELPTIEITPASDGGNAMATALENLEAYDWLVVTSVNTVDRVVPLIGDLRRLASIQVAAIGPGTAAALRAYGIDVDVVPDEYVAESLVEAMPYGPGRVLLPRAAVARDVLPEGLERKGWVVDVVEAYRTVDLRPDPAAIEAARTADAITFTASSTVAAYVRVAGVAGIAPVVACIGPVTAETAREHGIEVHVVATEHTIPGLISALEAHFAELSPDGKANRRA